MSVHERIEYGVLVDQTDIGHGYRLAEVSTFRGTAEASAKHYRELEGRPVEVKRRRVITTDWEPLSRPGDQS